jgi:hypothetical protein
MSILPFVRFFRYNQGSRAEDRALLESNLSVRAMPRQKAPAGLIAAGAFSLSVLAHKRKTHKNNSAEGGSFLSTQGIGLGT